MGQRTVLVMGQEEYRNYGLDKVEEATLGMLERVLVTKHHSWYMVDDQMGQVLVQVLENMLEDQDVGELMVPKRRLVLELEPENDLEKAMKVSL